MYRTYFSLFTNIRKLKSKIISTTIKFVLLAKILKLSTVYKKMSWNVYFKPVNTSAEIGRASCRERV